ncbi:MAG: mannose-1-phosphate guanylyltransferase [Flexilinea sp.]|jgi:mannose-1-phosphate guanylyltransferase
MTTSNPDFFAVIMAGGGGTRLWPWSRKEKPKQMLKVTGDKTMFQMTLDRLKGLIDPSNILVVTTEEQAAKLMELSDDLPAENYLIEPIPRGTASVIGLAAIHLQNRSKNSIMAVLTADHFIKNVPDFQQLLKFGYQAAEADHLVTLGIKPFFASTGMGYIEQGRQIPAGFDHPLFEAVRFTEKPDQPAADEFIRSGIYVWNSGMFIWKSNRIIEEISRHIPDLSGKLDQISSAMKSGSYDAAMRDIWPTIQPVTIDYGIMEKADDVVVLPAYSLGWSDIGSWDSIYDVLPPDENGNITINCKSHQINSSGTLTCSDDPEKMIIIVGMKDTVVVETDRAVLVCPRNETQKVRDIVAYLKNNNLEEYL